MFTRKVWEQLAGSKITQKQERMDSVLEQKKARDLSQAFMDTEKLFAVRAISCLQMP